MTERLAYEIAADPSTFQEAFKRMQTAAQKLDADIRKIGSSGDAFKGLQGAFNDFKTSTAGLQVNTEAAKGAMDHLSLSSSGVRRELIVLAHEMSQGNYSRFGGSLMVIGERMDILSAVFSSTGVAVAGFAAIVAGAVVALVKGAEESRNFENAMRLTGDVAGITSGQFHDMSVQVAQLTDGRFAAAAKAMQAAVSSGAFTGDVVEQVAEVSTRIADLSGEASDKVVEQFAKMAEGGKDYAAELNRAYNFLTPAQYEHIRQLQDEGRESDAFRQTLALLNTELGTRTPQNLGLASRAWDFLGNSINHAWDMLKGIGRDSTVEDKLAAAQADLAKIQSGGGSGGLAASWNTEQQAREHVEALKKQIADRAAAAEADRQNQARIGAIAFVNDQVKTYESGAQKMKEEIDKFNKQADLAGNLSPEQRAQTIQAIQDKFTPKEHVKALHLKPLKEDTEGNRETEKQLADMQRSFALYDSEYLRHATSIAQMQDMEAKERLDKGEITEQQYTEIMAAAEDRRYNQEHAELQKELSLLDAKTSAFAEVNTKIERLQDQHALKMAQLATQMAAAQRKAADDTAKAWQGILSPITTAFSQTVQGVIMGTQTWRQGMSKMYASIGQSALSSAAQEIAIWTSKEIAKTTIGAEFAQTRLLIEQGASLESIAISAETAIKDIAIKAYQAMAGAWAAISAIPYVGPFLAPAIAAGAFAGVIALGANIASASGGYDIPAGVNPIVQAHAREMVLPPPQADVIRDLARGGGAGSGDVHLHLHTIDARTGVRFLMDNKHAVAAALKSAVRDGAR